MHIKGNISFELEHYSLLFNNKKITPFGVTDLPWSPLDPQRHFGKIVQAKIEITLSVPLTLDIKACLIREQTPNNFSMGMRFLPTDKQRAQFSEYVKKHGVQQLDHARKYPRIPSSNTIQTFPLRALVVQDPSEPLSDHFPLICDVHDISPGGILLSNESQGAYSIMPGQSYALILEPRGWFPVPIRVQGTIRRINDDMNIKNGNFIRYLGIQFSKIDEINRAAFLDLLKDILEKMKTQMSSSKS
jgi:hypothetical protein